MKHIRLAYQFIILFGLVSLCGDIVYEGARAVIGPFFATLGASATVVGMVAGLGEFLGYGFRLISGFLSDRLKRYWMFTFLGYGLLLSVPFLAFAGNWPLAAMFIILERMGKGIRSPARDVLLSHATAKVGHGTGFGLHEALDQIGAVVGPLIVALVFSLKNSYRLGFATLFLPGLLTLFFLTVAYKKSATLTLGPGIKAKFKRPKGTKLPIPFWLYLGFSFFSVMGFVTFQLISYHFKIHSIISPTQIALYYALAMGVDAIAALIIGKIYDQIGFKCLFIIPFLTCFLPWFAFSFNCHLALGGVILWGIIIGIHETIMRAGVADLIPLDFRGTAYGLFNTSYGLAWFIGNSILGLLYSRKPNLVWPFVVLVETTSVIFIWKMIWRLRNV